MRTIEEIRQRLTKYPNVKYEVKENSLTVFPTSEDGFEVAIYYAGDEEEFSVFFAGWHEAFSSRDEALNCFALGLSTACRLKEYRRGDTAYKWTVEYREDGRWVSDSTSSLIFFPFWRPKKTRYLQNTLVT